MTCRRLLVAEYLLSAIQSLPMCRPIGPLSQSAGLQPPVLLELFSFAMQAGVRHRKRCRTDLLGDGSGRGHSDPVLVPDRHGRHGRRLRRLVAASKRRGGRDLQRVSRGRSHSVPLGTHVRCLQRSRPVSCNFGNLGHRLCRAQPERARPRAGAQLLRDQLPRRPAGPAPVTPFTATLAAEAPAAAAPAAASLPSAPSPPPPPSPPRSPPPNLAPLPNSCSVDLVNRPWCTVNSLLTESLDLYTGLCDTANALTSGKPWTLAVRAVPRLLLGMQAYHSLQTCSASDQQSVCAPHNARQFPALML